MPISLRLPADVERQIAGYSARHGVSKSAVIVRSISEFLANHTQPSSFQIYEEAMREERNQRDDAKRESAEQRPHKIKAHAVLRGRHARRSRRASQALPAPPGRARSSS